ncbi:MAG: hypothetical protein JNJ88_15710 [Planctomycetes bacterium]|nr:hypothetical protein [Planctomycetota bacterium]
MDAEGVILAKPEERSVAGFEKTGAAAKRVVAARAKAASGDSAARNDLFLLELEMGLLEFTRAKAQMGSLRLTDDQSKRAKALLIDAEADSMFKTKLTPENRDAINRRFEEMVLSRELPVSSSKRMRVLRVAMASAAAASKADVAAKIHKAAQPEIEAIGDAEERKSTSKFFDNALAQAKGEKPPAKK